MPWVRTQVQSRGPPRAERGCHSSLPRRSLHSPRESLFKRQDGPDLRARQGEKTK